jgi:hypothetical protein
MYTGCYIFFFNKKDVGGEQWRTEQGSVGSTEQGPARALSIVQ